ncbi:hypothetical protein BSF41_40410 [Flavobacterium sp. ACN2]|nr:hypothetical protein [Flavobacterium sp. ACN2]PBI84713.1 hypothetical protein BSF41_40410 [Flavobacterium sp. ACN2]
MNITTANNFKPVMDLTQFSAQQLKEALQRVENKKMKKEMLIKN